MLNTFTLAGAHQVSDPMDPASDSFRGDPGDAGLPDDLDVHELAELAAGATRQAVIVKLIFGVFWAIVVRGLALTGGPAFGAAPMLPAALRNAFVAADWVIAVALVIATFTGVSRMLGPRAAGDRLAFRLTDLYLVDIAIYGGFALARWPASHVGSLLLFAWQVPLAVTALAIRAETAWARHLPARLG
jgi:hypothetical protein